MKQFLASFTLLALLVSSPLKAASVSITTSKDNTIYESTSGDLSNGAGPNIIAGSIRTLEIRRALLAFDIASVVPAGSTITSVQLDLFLTNAPIIQGGTMHSHMLHRATADWGEGTSNAAPADGQGAPPTAGDATWLHTFSPGSYWSTPGGDFVASTSATTSVGTSLGIYTWGSTPEMISDVQGWLDNPSQAFGWFLLGQEGVGKSARRFGSRDAANPAERPELTIEYTAPVPEPGTLSLALLGLIGLIKTGARFYI